MIRWALLPFYPARMRIDPIPSLLVHQTLPRLVAWLNCWPNRETLYRDRRIDPIPSFLVHQTLPRLVAWLSSWLNHEMLRRDRRIFYLKWLLFIEEVGCDMEGGRPVGDSDRIYNRSFF